MYRRDPTKATPANVQCQKCLKKGHYSYECKASTQERPYVSRPSRTQQLLNPKLAPKLASDVQDALAKQKGVADEELAKREAERARKRELEDNDSEGGSPKRKRSVSYDSVSSISTRGSLSPPRAQQASTVVPDFLIEASNRPPPPPPAGRAPRERSYSSDSDSQRRYSPNPPRRARNDSRSDRPSRKPLSPTRGGSPATGDEGPSSRRRGYSPESDVSPPPPRERRRYRSRSPEPSRNRDRSPPRHSDKRGSRDPVPSRGGGQRRGGAPPRREREQRDRSLSPFSKRLALTQAMNTSR
ncbi:zinc knuckle-domain-containing protein [Hypoxylon fragiforme]|uniref:zinc knuckle-domain-containing protein n=1 Tax=Hypoxylon fragiforme TaxID=63214 RepID=UPI0020C63E4C|nr:zinc knuckle-domain-containing protein [Hypoxylon fragiforme]KAI2605860.1 zinc knuckle-domain-containing protein [Hypoxylon fragiforme]